jgi:hypothetical protein
MAHRVAGAICMDVSAKADLCAIKNVSLFVNTHAALKDTIDVFGPNNRPCITPSIARYNPYSFSMEIKKWILRENCTRFGRNYRWTIDMGK